MKLAMHILKGRPNGPLFERCIASALKTTIPFKVINNVNNTDIVRGRLEGFDTDAEFITWLDDDDESLLAPEETNKLLNLKKDCVFTNSLVVASSGIITKQIPDFVNQWTLNFELGRICRPHPTMIIKRDIAVRLMNETALLIKEKEWGNDIADYVFRLLVSKHLGWHYENSITYKWYIHSDSHHQKNPLRFTPIKEYLFKK
jgi:hypothetical protein